MASATRSTREALTSARETIARVRASVGDVQQRDVSDDAATAYDIADAWERHGERLVQEATLATVSRDFRAHWPALVRWRDRVLATRRGAKRSDVAAAYELLALECTLAGAPELAARASERAHAAMTRHVRSRTTESPSEARSA